jgi:hypothetical protein
MSDDSEFACAHADVRHTGVANKSQLGMTKKAVALGVAYKIAQEFTKDDVLRFLATYDNVLHLSDGNGKSAGYAMQLDVVCLIELMAGVSLVESFGGSYEYVKEVWQVVRPVVHGKAKLMYWRKNSRKGIRFLREN